VHSWGGIAMNEQDAEQSRESWNRLAANWADFVGDEGDRNRFLNSDPVLWSMAGDVEGLRVLDAGCGGGYLSNQLQAKGANVTGVDVSEQMIEIARERCPAVEFHATSIAAMPLLAAARRDRHRAAPPASRWREGCVGVLTPVLSARLSVVAGWQ
jgi:2-polyprenyl-3-methyl-5-hydroxy-6-metoxy-1,4-benzoquinol methylase